MIYPNKHIRIEDSIIFKMLFILENTHEFEINIHELFSRTKKHFTNPDEFIYSLDVLYILDVIDVDFEKETIKYVKRN